MKARALLIGATFDPETMKVMFAAFDTAWAEIAHHFDGDPEVEAARLRLANAVLATASKNNTDVEALKNSALQVMALTAPRQSNLSGDKSPASTWQVPIRSKPPHQE